MRVPLTICSAGFLTLLLCSAQDTAEAHRAAAKAVAGQQFQGLYNTVCAATPAPTAAARPAANPALAQRQDPPREQWYMPPVQVFDNLYYVGTKIHSSWAITTSDGIIVLDTLYSYASEPEIVDGLKKLGLDPAKIKYVILSHGHGDHDGGAKMLQARFDSRLIVGGPDWELMQRDQRNPAPAKDMVAADGQKITLGDETLTLYLTPGHTLGTISTLVPVKDRGAPHLAAEWGGTAIFPTIPIEQLKSYISSAERFRDIAAKAGADVIITNHTEFDDALAKLKAEQERKPGQPNPYVIGTDAVKRYLTVAEECAKAILAERTAGRP